MYASDAMLMTCFDACCDAVKEPWGGIKLSYKTEFPLDLIVSDDVIAKYVYHKWNPSFAVSLRLLISYNSLFRFLFSVKKVQLELQATWARMQSAKGARGSKLTPAQRLRALMSFMLDNLQYYLQVRHVLVLTMLENPTCFLLVNRNGV